MEHITTREENMKTLYFYICTVADLYHRQTEEVTDWEQIRHDANCLKSLNCFVFFSSGHTKPWKGMELWWVLGVLLHCLQHILNTVKNFTDILHLLPDLVVLRNCSKSLFLSSSCSQGASTLSPCKLNACLIFHCTVNCNVCLSYLKLIFEIFQRVPMNSICCVCWVKTVNLTPIK